MTDYREVRTEHYEPGRASRVAFFKLTNLIWLLFGILEAALGLRILFKLLAVNPANPFAAFLYNVTDLFLFPFAGLVESPTFDGMVLEVYSFIAMIIYLIIAWVIDRLVFILFYRPRGPRTVRQTSVSDHTHVDDPAHVDDHH